MGTQTHTMWCKDREWCGTGERELYWNIIIRIMYLWHHFLIYMKRLSFVIRPHHIVRCSTCTFFVRCNGERARVFVSLCVRISKGAGGLFARIFLSLPIYLYLILQQMYTAVKEAWCANAIKMAKTQHLLHRHDLLFFFFFVYFYLLCSGLNPHLVYAHCFTASARAVCLCAFDFSFLFRSFHFGDSTLRIMATFFSHYYHGYKFFCRFTFIPFRWYQPIILTHYRFALAMACVICIKNAV